GQRQQQQRGREGKPAMPQAQAHAGLRTQAEIAVCAAMVGKASDCTESPSFLPIGCKERAQPAGAVKQTVSWRHT
ncbi:MAG: hypothetical protein KDI56_17125, partial [Xanthomonadales bacterium]|nr:hypothetical protein [Xanthomonadales bacterium]